jgi:hypothetical protein
MRLDERVEGAVAKADRAVLAELRLVAVPGQRAEQPATRRAGPGHLGSLLAHLRGSRPQLIANGRFVHPLERAGEDLGGTVVAAGGERDVELPTRTPVDTGGPPRARPDPAGQPPVVGVEEPSGRQLVQMERRERTADLHGARRLFSSHRLALGGHPVVERPPHGIVEQAQCREVVACLVHGRTVSRRFAVDRLTGDSVRCITNETY